MANYKYFSLQYNPTCQIWSLSGCGRSLADGNKWFKLCDLGWTWPKCCWKACYFIISVQMSSFLTRKAPEFCLQFLTWAILYIVWYSKAGKSGLSFNIKFPRNNPSQFYRAHTGLRSRNWYSNAGLPVWCFDTQRGKFWKFSCKRTASKSGGSGVPFF